MDSPLKVLYMSRSMRPFYLQYLSSRGFYGINV